MEKLRLLLILCVFLRCTACSSEGSAQDGNVSGGKSTHHYYMIGTVLEIEEEKGQITVRPHGESEDADFKYKKILHYLDAEKVTLEPERESFSLSSLQVDDVVYFSFFADNEEEIPIPVDQIELLDSEQILK